MEKKLSVILIGLLIGLPLFADKSEGNPFKKFGYHVEVGTFGDGEEFHDGKEVVEIGLVLYNTIINEVVGFVEGKDIRIELPKDIISTSIDPHCERYYSTSPYAYCFNNPVNLIDPDGKDVYMLFYGSGDARFKSAAETRQREIMNSEGYDQNKDKVYIMSVGDLGTLGERVNNIVQDALDNGYGMTVEASFWTHSALDGPRGDKSTSGPYQLSQKDHNQMTGEGWSNINWNFDLNNSVAAFYGCRSASFAEKFLDYSNVANSAGQGGAAGPSYSTGKFDDVSFIKSFDMFKTSKNIYYGTRSEGQFIGPTLYNRQAGVANYTILNGNAKPR